MRLVFDHGTLVLLEAPDRDLGFLPGVIWDPRVCLWRAPAHRHAEIVEALGRTRIPFVDEAAPQSPLLPTFEMPELRSYQEAALLAWHLAERRGIAVLPTGAGKTRLALAAMAAVGRRALCVVPTRALLRQWHAELEQVYAGRIGLLGDGRRELGDVTLATFESAWRAMPEIGRHFELLIVDEAHHFGAGLRDEALELCLAPARLGLTATPPEEPALGRLESLVGPIVYQLGIADLAGTFLADFELIVMRLPFDPDERRTYQAERRAFTRVFREFMRLYPHADFEEFRLAAQRSEEGRAALAAGRRSRKLVNWTRAKARAVSELLAKHRAQKVLVFVADNDTAYAVAQSELVTPITCDIKRREREAAIADFKSGAIRTLVSARVLNEGIDVPDADVAIVVAGTHGEREHVQRVGRLLRPAPGKRARVYELVTRQSVETRSAFERRRGLFARGTGGDDARP